MSEADKDEYGKTVEKNDVVRENQLTYDDYAALDDGLRYELVDGTLELMSPSPSVTHQLVSFELERKIADSCENDYIIIHAPIDLILSNHEVRQPDLVLIHRSRMHILTQRGIVGAPDLVIEILSPSTLKRDKIGKLSTYARYEIPEYWIVEPVLGILEQYLLQGNRYELVNIFQGEERVTSSKLPCIGFSMKEIKDRIPNIER